MAPRHVHWHGTSDRTRGPQKHARWQPGGSRNGAATGCSGCQAPKNNQISISSGHQSGCQVKGATTMRTQARGHGPTL